MALTAKNQIMLVSAPTKMKMRIWPRNKNVVREINPQWLTLISREIYNPSATFSTIPCNFEHCIEERLNSKAQKASNGVRIRSSIKPPQIAPVSYQKYRKAYSGRICWAISLWDIYRRLPTNCADLELQSRSKITYADIQQATYSEGITPKQR